VLKRAPDKISSLKLRYSVVSGPRWLNSSVAFKKRRSKRRGTSTSAASQASFPIHEKKRELISKV
jgi:hypothetical protein